MYMMYREHKDYAEDGRSHFRDLTIAITGFLYLGAGAFQWRAGANMVDIMTKTKEYAERKKKGGEWVWAPASAREDGGGEAGLAFGK